MSERDCLTAKLFFFIISVVELVERVNTVPFCACVYVSSVSHAFASVHCCLVITCWERADRLALVGDVCCVFVTFPCGILGQVWYLIVLFPHLCHLSYFVVVELFVYCCSHCLRGLSVRSLFC